MHVVRLHLLAQVLRRPSHHQSRDKHRYDDKDQHSVHARPNAAEHNLAHHDVHQRNHPAQRHERIVHRVHRAAARVCRHRRKQRRVRNPEPHLLAFHVPTGRHRRPRHRHMLVHALQQRVRLRLRPVARQHAAKPQNRHRREHRPSVPRRPGHPAQHHAHPGGDHEDREHLHQVRQRRRVLKWVRRVRIHKPAAVGPQHLDRFLAGQRPLRNRLGCNYCSYRLSICAGCRYTLLLHQRRRVVRLEVLDRALRHQRQRVHQADRQQHPQRPPRQVHPEVPQRLRLAPRYPADKRDRQRHARRRRPEVVRRQPRHLGQIAHRLLRHIRLPVRVGGKRSRRVPRQVRFHRRKVLRVPQRDRVLQPLNRIRQQQRRATEDQHGHAILRPAHLRVRVHARQLVQQPLHRNQHRVQPGLLALVHPSHVQPHRLRREQHQHKEDRNLQPAVRGHQNFSGRNSANSR